MTGCPMWTKGEQMFSPEIPFPKKSKKFNFWTRSWLVRLKEALWHDAIWSNFLSPFNIFSSTPLFYFFLINHFFPSHSLKVAFMIYTPVFSYYGSSTRSWKYFFSFKAWRATNVLLARKYSLIDPFAIFTTLPLPWVLRIRMMYCVSRK